MPPVSDRDYRILESLPERSRAANADVGVRPVSARAPCAARARPSRPRAPPRRAPGRCAPPFQAATAISAKPGRQQREQRCDRRRSPHGSRPAIAGVSGLSCSTAGSRSSCSTVVPSAASCAEQRVVGAALELAARLPGVEVDDALHARLAQLLEAAEAGAERRVAVRAVERVAEPRGLQDGVLLGVHADAHVVGRAARVLLAVGAAVAAPLALVAAREAARRAVVARRDDAALAHEHRARRGGRGTPRARASRPR